MKIFESTNVCKEIDGITILDNISMTISKGERVAIEGNNGSGKSSLLKLIGGIYEETAGSLKRAKIKIGYVPEHFPENIRFKVYDYLMFIGKMNHFSHVEKDIDYFAEIFAIRNYLNTPLRKCSKGTKQKVGIIQALMKKPDLLLLDEPLTGLDHDAQKELLNQLKSLPNPATILFTAHEEVLVGELAERIVVLENGSIISDSSKMNIEKIRIIKVKLPTKEILAEIPSIQYNFVHEHIVEIMIPALESDEVLMKLLNCGCSIIELRER